MDHQGQAFDVQAARGHVRGHQVAQLALLELAQDAGARGLGEIAVEEGRGQAGDGQLLGDLLGLGLGLGEDQGGAGLVLQQQVHEGAHVLVIGRQHGGVGDVGVDGMLTGLGQGDLDRILQEPLRQLGDGGGQGGREQVGLGARGDLGEDGFHILEEAHVQHLVALVEDDHAHLAQIQGAALQVVHDAARRAHDDLGALLQGLELGRVGHATHQGGDGELGHESVQLGAHLLGQLPRRSQDQGLRMAFTSQALQQRQAEGQGLARASAALHQQVAAFETGLDGLGLDGHGGLEAALGQGGQQGFAAAEGCEGHLIHWNLPGLSLRECAEWRSLQLANSASREGPKRLSSLEMP